MPDHFQVYYSLVDIAQRVGLSYTTIWNRYQAGEFSMPGTVLNFGSDIRIPWSNVEAWLSRHALTFPPREVPMRDVVYRNISPGISARNEGELRRKINKSQGGTVPGEIHSLAPAGSTPAPATNS